MEISELQSRIDKRSNEISGYECDIPMLKHLSMKYIVGGNPEEWDICIARINKTIIKAQILREEQTKDKRLFGVLLDQEWCVRNKKLYDPSKKYRKNVTKVSNKSYKIVCQEG